MSTTFTPSRTTYAGLLGLALLAACGRSGTEGSGLATSNIVDRGRYLVEVGACHDCHSPKILTAQGPMPDPSRLLSGHPASDPVPADLPAGTLKPDQWMAATNAGLTAWVGPWGTSFTANLTPDASGLKGWTPEMFIATIRNGKHAGDGRPLLPPMPWQNYSTMKDEDLRAIFAYLQSLPAIRNPVPAPIPPRTALSEPAVSELGAL
jgi:hypothetical protein